MNAIYTKGRMLNLLMECQNLHDFDERNLTEDTDRTRKIEFCLSWRRMLFVKGYVGSRLVFLTYLPVSDKDRVRDAFNTVRVARFFKYSDTMREAMENIGMQSQDYFEMVPFHISDVSETYPVVEGCVTLNFADTDTKFSGDVFARIIPTLYDRLCKSCDEYESSHDVLSELSRALTSYERLVTICNAKLTKESAGMVEKRLKQLDDEWNPLQYLLLSKHGTVRDQYARIVSAQKTLQLNLMRFHEAEAEAAAKAEAEKQKDDKKEKSDSST